MNRPFSAFAALLALLALAMFAVSSTSRSTTVQPPRTQSGSSIRYELRPAANFVFILPASEPEQDACAMATCLPETPDTALSIVRFLEAAGLQVAQGMAALTDVYESLHRSALTSLVPAHVVPAQPVVGSSTAILGVDCHSHYDQPYDRAVYGPIENELAPQNVRGRTGVERNLSDAELLAIFQDLGAVRQAPRSHDRPWSLQVLSRFVGDGMRARYANVINPHPAAAPPPSPRGRGVWMRLEAHAAAIGAWLFYQIESWATNSAAAAADSHAVIWNDYEELIDGARRPALANTAQISTSDAAAGVLFGDWLRHSAASSLNSFGQLLQGLAIELD